MIHGHPFHSDKNRIKHVTFQINLHLLELSSYHPICPNPLGEPSLPELPFLFWRAAPAGFAKIPDANILGNIQNLDVNAWFMWLSTTNTVQISPNIQSQVCIQRVTKIYVPIGNNCVMSYVNLAFPISSAAFPVSASLRLD